MRKRKTPNKCTKKDNVKENNINEIIAFATGYPGLMSFYGEISKSIDIFCKTETIAHGSVKPTNPDLICNDIAATYNCISICNLHKFGTSVKNPEKRRQYQLRYQRYMQNAILRIKQRLPVYSAEDIKAGIQMHCDDIL
jgi:hypothetical protein